MFSDILKGIDDFGKWINNPSNVEAWFGNLFKPLTDAWNNTVKWFTDGWNSFVKKLQDSYNWIKSKWNQYIQPSIDGVIKLNNTTP